MTLLCFMDETGTDSSSSHYSIGALIMPQDFLFQYQCIINDIRVKHSFTSEIKWTKTHKTYGLINTGLNLFYELLLNEHLHFQCITVDKALYKNWTASTKEQAFYYTFTQVIAKSAEILKDNLNVHCDQRNDSYDKHHEVCKIIANYTLNDEPLSQINEIIPCDSKECDAIQVVDYITGAINAAHRHYKNNHINLNDGKLCCIDRMSKILNWEDLAWDTWKNDKFNIWTFPIQSRANRGCSKNFSPQQLSSPIYLSSVADITRDH